MWANRVAFAVLLLPLVFFSSRKLRDDVETAARLRHEPWSARQRALYGDWFATVQQLPAGAPVDIIMTTPDAWGVAVFASSSLAPRPCRLFLGEDAWRRRERAQLVHDARAINATGPIPGPARIVLTADENALRVR